MFQHLQAIFLDNGFETLELFKQLDEADLQTLGISDATDKAKILTAVALLPDDDCDNFSCKALSHHSANYLDIKSCSTTVLPFSTSFLRRRTKHISYNAPIQYT